MNDHKDLEEYLRQFCLAPPPELLYPRLIAPGASAAGAAPLWTWRGWGFEAVLTAALLLAVLLLASGLTGREESFDQSLGPSEKTMATSLETTEATARYLVAHLNRNRQMLEREAADRWRVGRGGPR